MPKTNKASFMCPLLAQACHFVVRYVKNTKSVGKLSFRMACVEVHKPIKVLVMNRKNQMILKIFINYTVDYHRLLQLKFSEHSKIQSALQDKS